MCLKTRPVQPGFRFLWYLQPGWRVIPKVTEL